MNCSMSQMFTNVLRMNNEQIGGSFVKVSRHIEFEEHLNLAPFCSRFAWVRFFKSLHAGTIRSPRLIQNFSKEVSFGFFSLPPAQRQRNEGGMFFSSDCLWVCVSIVCVSVNPMSTTCTMHYLESFERSPWNFYWSNIWSKARTSSKKAAFWCNVACGWWFKKER